MTCLVRFEVPVCVGGKASTLLMGHCEVVLASAQESEAA